MLLYMLKILLKLNDYFRHLRHLGNHPLKNPSPLRKSVKAGIKTKENKQKTRFLPFSYLFITYRHMMSHYFTPQRAIHT